MNSSLFSFNFLNDEGPSAPAQKEEQKSASPSEMVNDFEQQNNFHNFFVMNDKIFGSPSPSPDMSS